MADLALISRRSLVAVAPAAVVAATAPPLAYGADAALLALREPYRRTLAVMDQTAKPHSRAEDAYFAMKTAGTQTDERALRKASGLVVAERAYVRATKANSAVVDEISRHPARTLDGLIFKAQVSRREDNMNRDLVESIVADILVMGGLDA